MEWVEVLGNLDKEIWRPLLKSCLFLQVCGSDAFVGLSLFGTLICCFKTVF